MTGMQEWLVVGHAGVAINSMQEWPVVGHARVARCWPCRSGY